MVTLVKPANTRPFPGLEMEHLYRRNSTLIGRAVARQRTQSTPIGLVRRRASGDLPRLPARGTDDEEVAWLERAQYERRSRLGERRSSTLRPRMNRAQATSLDSQANPLVRMTLLGMFA
jgi:hypothetical protein